MAILRLSPHPTHYGGLMPGLPSSLSSLQGLAKPSGFSQWRFQKGGRKKDGKRLRTEKPDRAASFLGAAL